MDELVDIAQDVRSLIDTLDEIALDALRVAVAEGTGQRPPHEKRVSQARRALEKAAGLLETATTDETS